MADQLLVALLAHLEDLEEGFRSGGLDSRADGHGARRSNVNVDLARALRRRIPETPFPLDALTEAYRLRGWPAEPLSVPEGRTEEQAVVEASGAGMIAAERQRQVASEGWSPEHDAQHRYGELADAAVCYAMSPAIRDTDLGVRTHSAWWPGSWVFKPTPDDRIRELVKAGALIAAEIDRLRAALDRALSTEGEARG